MCTSAVRSVSKMALVFRCMECEDMFANQRNLNRHLICHSMNLWFSCHYCAFVSKRNDSLKRHLDKYHATSKSFTKTLLPPVAETSPSLQPPISLHRETAHDQQQMVPLYNHVAEFDKRLQLPHNFIYAGATQSVSFPSSFKNICSSYA